MYMAGTAHVHDLEKGGKLAKFMASYDDALVNYYEEVGLEGLPDDKDEEEDYGQLTDAELDMLHEARINPSMIKGYFGLKK